jgi:hypothetical protein
VIVENQEGGLQGSDIQGLSADLLEAARRRNLSANSLAAYERTWTRFLAWAAAAGFDPRSLPFPTALDAYRLELPLIELTNDLAHGCLIQID